MMPATTLLPTGVTVFERGWLSANNIFLTGTKGTALIDSGYSTHSEQTLLLVKGALGDRALDLLINTHLHSDHCGGNSALQDRYPNLTTLIPPGLAAHVREWNPFALTYVPTGQTCPRFELSGVIQPGTEVELADSLWQVHAAPGHDAHSIVLFEPVSRTLISADALWETGFGVIFQELEGIHAFDEVRSTLDLIESLRPSIVIPGHGRVFQNITLALDVARKRLDRFINSPKKHASHAAKVLIKFKLLELGHISMSDLRQWAAKTLYFTLVHQRWFRDEHELLPDWIENNVRALAVSGALEMRGDLIINR